jgi:hypothetical protein
MAMRALSVIQTIISDLRDPKTRRDALRASLRIVQ